MSTYVSALVDKFVDLQYNPAGMQRLSLQTLTDVTNGAIEIVDPTNPFVFALEISAVMTAAAMMKNEANTRKQYAVAAQTPEDLYMHMSDRDYANRFATPSRTKFGLMLPKEEVLQKMVTDPTTGTKKIVIPRNTYFTIADTIFSLQYPIEIRQLAHGGIQIVYDGEKPSPLFDLTTNIIEWELRRDASGTGNEFIHFEFDVHQFNIITQTNSTNSATDFKLDIPIKDQYYYTRVYSENAQGQWIEMRTTHSEQIYDPKQPTAVLQVVDKLVRVKIPQIYTSTGLLNRNIRVDVYETKGRLDMVLSNYPLSAYTAVWQTLDKNDDTQFSAPLKTFKAIIPYSNRVVTGGGDTMAFEKLREMVIQNAMGDVKVPITNVQIETALNVDGYEVIKNIDNITNRVFLATRSMPTPVNEKLITAAAAAIETVSLSIDDIVLMDSVIDNDDSVTITPSTLYQTRNGITSLVPSQQIEEVLSLAPDQRALMVNLGNYLYTPFHYVLDMTEKEFDVRAYYLDAPVIETKLFVAENDTTLLQVATKGYGIKRTPSGYQLQVVTQSGDNFKEIPDDQLFVQLAFVPVGEKDRAYLLGTLDSITEEGERVYNFDLSSTFNVNKQDKIELTKFFLYSTEDRITKAGLLTEFDIIYSTTANLGKQWVSGAVDKTLGKFLLPEDVAGIAHEKLRVRFGYALGSLWARARSVISTAVYKKYEANVPQFYEENIYQRDPLTGATITIDDEGQLHSTLLHSKGDPVLNEDGEQVYKFYIGDIVLDANGNPIIENPRGMTRQLDVMLIEGAYWFATDATTAGYRTDLTNTIVDWVTNDIEKLTDQLLDKSRIYFYPKTTLGDITVMIQDGLITTIPSGQTLQVRLHVNRIVYGNEELKSQLTTETIRIISEKLNQATVSVSEITAALRTQYAADVIDVDFSGLGGEMDLHALTVVDPGERCSIKKRLIAMPDDSLVVQEDVLISFIRHEVVV
jgi:hypothetical protein